MAAIRTLIRLSNELTLSKYDKPYLTLLLIFELLVGATIILKIPYTEIDWTTYMQQVSLFFERGEYDYLEIKGDTGPLVYPAGFLYLYGLLGKLTGGGGGEEIRSAQWIFLGLYMCHAFVVLMLYGATARRLVDGDAVGAVDDGSRRSRVVWRWRIAMLLCCLSKRIHSIFLLRLFNDAPAMLLFYLSAYIFAFAQNRWNVGCVLFSVAVSVKMNILLFAPGLWLLWWQRSKDWKEVMRYLGICASVQLILGFPFLWNFPVNYIKKAFELDRVFLFKWSVNWKFLPEEIFVSKPLSVLLLALHISVLILFLKKWLSSAKSQTRSQVFLCSNHNDTSLTPQYVLHTLFVSNFIGICFARTLHYQFYSWYFSSLPFMILCCRSPTSKMIPLGCLALVWGGVEYAFNVFPATGCSSGVLQVCHFVVLGFLWFGDVPAIMVRDNSKDS